MVVLVVRLLLTDFAEEVDFEVGSEDVGWQDDEFLFIAGAPADLEDGRLEVKVVLRKSNLELGLRWWIVIVNTLDVAWVVHRNRKGVDLDDSA